VPIELTTGGNGFFAATGDDSPDGGMVTVAGVVQLDATGAAIFSAAAALIVGGLGAFLVIRNREERAH
jgi:hypothetical protein